MEVEAQALALVTEAQIEADRRLADAEKRNLARYQEQYSKAFAQLDEEHAKKLLALREAYASELDAYRQGLEGMLLNQAQFRILLDTFFAEEYRSSASEG